MKSSVQAGLTRKIFGGLKLATHSGFLIEDKNKGILMDVKIKKYMLHMFTFMFVIFIGMNV